ncbi:MarR family winged helix-turn-helix transcriptional regulator [Arthrobacter sp. ZGTC412]|uniref:MarR family winged helix-turn-helix transcriptional regulator n=1 Tax=Arthrobacter sp. ZGTC412 TaxID=2058900 RepID=UPI000CE30670|nr:MarR family transcriptional regulator [Arthrobacter sp. ZGTC412]
MAGKESSANPGPPAGEGPHPLVRLLQEFTLEANRYVDTAGGRKDMHRTDLNALAVIMRHTANGGTVTPGLLRKELNLSSPATTALIDRLDSSGHVVRERDSADRRQVHLRMTPKAFQDGSAIFAPLSRRMGGAMADFSPEELETVTRFMAAMIEATVAAREEASTAPNSPTPPK